MKVLVTVKRVVDFNVRIRVKSDQSAVDTDNVTTDLSSNSSTTITIDLAKVLDGNSRTLKPGMDFIISIEAGC